MWKLLLALAALLFAAGLLIIPHEEKVVTIVPETPTSAPPQPIPAKTCGGYICDRLNASTGELLQKYVAVYSCDGLETLQFRVQRCYSEKMYAYNKENISEVFPLDGLTTQRANTVVNGSQIQTFTSYIIVIRKNLTSGREGAVLRHELCHVGQSREGRALSEIECYGR